MFVGAGNSELSCDGLAVAGELTHCFGGPWARAVDCGPGGEGIHRKKVCFLFCFAVLRMYNERSSCGVCNRPAAVSRKASRTPAMDPARTAVRGGGGPSTPRIGPEPMNCVTNGQVASEDSNKKRKTKNPGARSLPSSGCVDLQKF